jgi:hypothetical protein
MKPLERPTYTVTLRTGISAIVAMMCLAILSTSGAAEDKDTAIRPFRVNVPRAALSRSPPAACDTRWPTKELVEDRSQGVQLATLRELARYWTTEYDWRKAEHELNACRSS